MYIHFLKIMGLIEENSGILLHYIFAKGARQQKKCILSGGVRKGEGFDPLPLKNATFFSK